jgi:hypothetical protein
MLENASLTVVVAVEGTANTKVITALVTSSAMAAFAVQIRILAENRLDQVAVNITALSSTLIITSKEGYAIVGFRDLSFEVTRKIDFSVSALLNPELEPLGARSTFLFVKGKLVTAGASSWPKEIITGVKARGVGACGLGSSQGSASCDQNHEGMHSDLRVIIEVKGVLIVVVVGGCWIVMMRCLK